VALSSSNIVSYWTLDESSGARADSVGTNSLTVNGTVSAASGKLNNGVSINGTTGNYLSVASNSSLQTGNQSFCVAGWINANSVGTKLALAKAGGAGGNEWSIATDSSDSKIWFVFWNAQTVITKSPSAISSSTWYHFVAWVDATNNTANLCINNGTVQTSSLISYPSAGTAPLVIGAYSDGTFAWNGLIDEVTFWKGVPTSTDIANLYNNNSPLDLTGKTVHYYPMMESSGTTAADTAGGVTATASGATPTGGGWQFTPTSSVCHYLTIPYTAINSLQTPFSFSVWTYHDTRVNGGYTSGSGSSSYRHWFSGSGGANKGIYWRAHSGSDWYQGNGTAYSGSGDFSGITIGGWQLQTITNDGTNLRVYRNATQAWSATSSGYGAISHPTSGSWYIGAHDSLTPSNGMMDGRMKYLGIWNRALSPSDITSLYNSGTPFELTFSSGYMPPIPRRNLVPVRRSYNW